jgi:hypothetical protein
MRTDCFPALRFAIGRATHQKIKFCFASLGLTLLLACQCQVSPPPRATVFWNQKVSGEFFRPVFDSKGLIAKVFRNQRLTGFFAAPRALAALRSGVNRVKGKEPSPFSPVAEARAHSFSKNANEWSTRQKSIHSDTFGQ